MSPHRIGLIIAFIPVCMHLMRSRFLNQYTARVRYPYTTNPFPTSELPSDASASLTPDLTRNIRPPPTYSEIQTKDTKQSPKQALKQTPLYASVNVSRRETRVLDLFIAAAVRTQMEKYDSELFMSSEGYAGISSDFGGESTAGEGDTTTDLFALHQPRARLEDLVLAEAWQSHLVASSQATTSQAQRSSTIQASSVAIDLRRRSAGLRLPAASSSYGALRTVLEVPRRAGESLEDTAHAIVTAWRELG